jgi:hypothetical protein
MIAIEPFLYVFAVGGFICAAMWLFCRKMIRRSWVARAIFCFLVAATITPTAVKFLWSWSVIPAIAFAPITFCGDKDWIYGFLYGTIPICAVASIIFGVWVFILRRHEHVA